MIPKPTLAAALATLLLCGCAGPGARARVNPDPAAVPHDGLDAVAWTQTALEHDLVYQEVFRAAGGMLLRALADPHWDALPRAERSVDPAALAPAVILDIDETVLDNSPFQARLVRSGGTFDEAAWARWCREAAARPLPGALAFTRLAADHGVAVYYLSNRSRDLDVATLANLRAAGFPVPSPDVFLGRGTAVAGCVSKGGDKGCRRREVGRTHRVLLQVGDQLGDFLDVAVNTPAGRQAAMAPYADWIGERWFVLPNPTYGAWVSALERAPGPQDPTVRRREKLEALRY